MKEDLNTPPTETIQNRHASPCYQQKTLTHTICTLWGVYYIKRIIQYTIYHTYVYIFGLASIAWSYIYVMSK